MNNAKEDKKSFISKYYCIFTGNKFSSICKCKSSNDHVRNPRLWGSDRYETATKVAQTGWTSTSDYAVIASGEGYADALCAAPLAKANNAPILLTQNGDLNANALSELKRLNVKHAFIVGGTGVVSQNVEDKIKAQVGDVQRLAGQNRYETSVKVAEKLGTNQK
ncbi:cell wall-binding repeat-containing protein [Clostridium magnum]|uniref:N-acetylmuramoyl-L-alanine amidase LytC n=1 Tax=Clostridium magnum DSM 2767 TaxID=1121326 RepID=A0A161X7T4_9CLOT|nr:cell wall-binding repeat-containing protein [Clostridium magnum]KZL90206.1 N-acetylmuramoyl-L-alanine amidase LytC precursor [Clostridium magnum DSM 2767]